MSLWGEAVTLGLLNGGLIKPLKNVTFEASFHPLLLHSELRYANAPKIKKGKSLEIGGGSLMAPWGPMKPESGFCKQNSPQSHPNERTIALVLFVRTHNRAPKNASWD